MRHVLVAGTDNSISLCFCFFFMLLLPLLFNLLCRLLSVWSRVDNQILFLYKLNIFSFASHLCLLTLASNLLSISLILSWLCCKSILVGFWSLVEKESTYWALVNSFNLQNELMDVHPSEISKMLFFSTNLATSRRLISFSSIKQVTPLASFSSSGFHMLVAERAHLLFLWGKIVRGITTTCVRDSYASRGDAVIVF